MYSEFKAKPLTEEPAATAADALHIIALLWHLKQQYGRRRTIGRCGLWIDAEASASAAHRVLRRQDDRHGCKHARSFLGVAVHSKVVPSLIQQQLVQLGLHGDLS